MKQFLLGFCIFLAFGLEACSSQPATDHDGTVRIRWARDPENLDPLVAPNPNALEAINLLYCSLLTVDYQKKTFVPWLAEALPEVELQDSLMLVTYRIRPEAAWDSTHAVLARDVAFTLKLMFCPGLPNEAFRAQYGFIQGIRLYPSEPRRFALVVRGRAPELVQASGDYSIFPEYRLDPKHQLRPISLAELRAPDDKSDLKNRRVLEEFARRYQQAQINRNSVGCGPYKVADWQTGRYLTLQRSANWWGSRVRPALAQLQAHPEAISYEIIPDEATALLALRRGDIDVYPMVPAREFEHLKQDKATNGLSFYTSDSYEMVTAGFNTRRPELRDASTRQALSCLFDVPGLIQASQQGMAYPSVSLVNPQAKALYNDSLPLLTLDLRKATELLGAAGWRKGSLGWTRQVASGPMQQLQPTFSYRAGDPAFEAIALQFRTAAARIGLQVQLRPTEASLFAKQLRAGEVDIYLQLLSGNPFVYNFAPILHSQSIGWGNFTGFGTAASDRLIDAIASEADPKRQAHMLRKFQLLLRQECPMAVLFFLKYRLAAASRLTDMHVTGIRPGYEAAAIRSKSQSTQQP